MSGFGISLQRDDVTKELRKLLQKARNPEQINRAIGTALVGLTKRAFNDPSLRPIPWPAKKDGTPATLKSKEANLWHSIRIQSVTASGVLIGSDRPYAAIHQLGGISRPMPQRPYFPIYQNALTQRAQTTIKEIVEHFMGAKGGS